MDRSNHPNVTLIHHFFKAYSENDITALKEIFHPEIQWHIPGRHPLSGTKKGVSEIVDYLNQLGKYNFKAEGIVLGVSEDHVIDCHRNWSEIEGEENLNNMSCLLWKIDNGKIKEVFNFPQDQYAVDEFFNNYFNTEPLKQ